MSLMIRKAAFGDFSVSVLFVAVMLLMPWDLIRGGEFADLRNYLARMYLLQDFGESYFYWENSLLGWLRFEIAWFKLLSIAVDWGVSPDVFFNSITAVSAFVAHQFLSRHVGGWWAFFILLNPISIDLFLSQIRSAFAFALFLLGFLFRSRLVKGVLFLIAPFVHVAMVLVLAYWLVSCAFVRFLQVTVRAKMFAVLGIAILVALIVGKYVPQIALEIGDRRDFSLFSTKSVSYVAFWLLWVFYVFLSVIEACEEDWRVYYVMLVGVSGALMDILGIPGFRFIALSIPIIFSVQGFILEKFRLQALGVSLVYLIVLYYLWIK